MLWVISNFFLFVLNLIIAINADSIGWAVFNGFFAGASFVLLLWSVADYDLRGDLW